MTFRIRSKAGIAPHQDRAFVMNTALHHLFWPLVRSGSKAAEKDINGGAVWCTAASEHMGHKRPTALQKKD
jgi:hypothetical protein